MRGFFWKCVIGNLVAVLLSLGWCNVWFLSAGQPWVGYWLVHKPMDFWGLGVISLLFWLWVLWCWMGDRKPRGQNWPPGLD